MITNRNRNFKYYEEKLKGKMWFPTEVKNSFTANFAIPIIVETKDKKNNLIQKLKENQISCRPLISGSMGTQPFYKKIYGEYKLPNASIIDERGMYLPNHDKMTKDEINIICNTLLSNI